jgi:iron complex outermembrane receptor protein
MALRKRGLFFGASVLVLTLPATTHAAAAPGDSAQPTPLGEVVVTAEKRPERISRLPVAISAYGGQTLSNAGVQGVRDLETLAPSLEITSKGSETYISIRGIGTQVASIGSEAGVTVSQDGVVFARDLFFDTDFLDVQRVEVLRGPQGTISGRNSTGGAINIISNRPTDKAEGEFDLTAGNYSRFAADGYISGPLSGERLLGRLAVGYDRMDGWLTNTFLDQKEGSIDRLHGRLTLLANLTDKLEAVLRVEGVQDNSTPLTTISRGRARPDIPSLAQQFGVPDTDLANLTIEADQRRDYARGQYGTSLQLAWQINPTTRLTSTTGFWKLDIRDIQDTDGTLVSIGDFPQWSWHLWQATQELTLTSDLTKRLDLIAGGLFLREKAQQPLEYVATVLGIDPGDYITTPVQDLTSYSGYGQLRYAITDSLRLFAGIRYTSDDKRYFETAHLFGATVSGGASHTWGAATPRVAIDFEPRKDLTIYANVSRGFKAGGYNTLTFGQDRFDPEYVWNYEAGVKSELFDGRVRAAATGFHMDYSNLQETVYLPGAGGVPTASVENVAKATIDGVEVELDGRLTDQLRIGFSGTWLDARIDDLTTGDPIYPELGQLNLAGNRLPEAPVWQFNSTIEYDVPLPDGYDLTLRADYSWRDRQFFDIYDHPLVSQGAYGLLNLNASIATAGGRWRLSLFAQNLTDERYFNFGAATVLLPGTPMNQGTLGQPRFYGLSIAHKF